MQNPFIEFENGLYRLNEIIIIRKIRESIHIMLKNGEKIVLTDMKFEDIIKKIEVYYEKEKMERLG